MNYRLTLQIIAAVITAGILVGISYGLEAIADNTSSDFVSGALFGGFFVGALFVLGHWVERKLLSDPSRGKH